MKKQTEKQYCPNCGSPIVEVQQNIRGIGSYFINLAEKTRDFEDLYESLRYTNRRKYAYCAGCGRRRMTVEEAESEVDKKN